MNRICTWGYIEFVLAVGCMAIDVKLACLRKQIRRLFLFWRVTEEVTLVGIVLVGMMGNSMESHFPLTRKLLKVMGRIVTNGIRVDP